MGIQKSPPICSLALYRQKNFSVDNFLKFSPDFKSNFFIKNLEYHIDVTIVHHCYPKLKNKIALNLYRNFDSMRATCDNTEHCRSKCWIFQVLLINYKMLQASHFFTLELKLISSKWLIPVSKIWYVNLGPLIWTWLTDLKLINVGDWKV